MLPHLTICYFTSRKNPCLQWFLDSLRRELGGSDQPGVKVLIVDFWRDQRAAWIAEGHQPSMAFLPEEDGLAFTHVSPKPSVWQGKHRLTKADYFAAANARNTALCLAPDGWIAFVDDLSVLLPGWFDRVRAAMAGGYIVCGAYRKVKNLVVSNGNVESFEDFPPGHDHRFAKGSDTEALPCAAEWTYGCSLAGPVEAFLQTNGYASICDSLGYEDCPQGLMMQRNGWTPRYDRRMLSYESEELHAQLPRFHREDPCKGDPNAKPRDDKSHAMLRILSGGSHPGYWDDGGIRALRQKILAGEPFPIVKHPEHDWFTGVPLKDMPIGHEAEIPLPYYDSNHSP